MLVSLSSYYQKKKRKHGLSKKIDTWRSMKKKDSHALKRIYIGREIIQKEFPFHPSQSMHVHILIWLYDLFFSLDPVFDFAIHVIQVCLILHTLPWAPHIAIIRARMKERQVKCLGEDCWHSLAKTNYSASVQRPMWPSPGSIPGISNPRNGKALTNSRTSSTGPIRGREVSG